MAATQKGVGIDPPKLAFFFVLTYVPTIYLKKVSQVCNGVVENSSATGSFEMTLLQVKDRMLNLTIGHDIRSELYGHEDPSYL